MRAKARRRTRSQHSPQNPHGEDWKAGVSWAKSGLNNRQESGFREHLLHARCQAKPGAEREARGAPVPTPAENASELQLPGAEKKAWGLLNMSKRS